MNQGQQSNAPPDPRNVSVLVVDGNPSSLASTVGLLEECAYKVRPTVARRWASQAAGAASERQACVEARRLCCGAQVTTVQTGSAALQLMLDNHRAAGSLGDCGFDILLKEHEPPASNAARFLKKLRAHECLRALPVIGEPGRHPRGWARTQARPQARGGSQVARGVERAAH